METLVLIINVMAALGTIGLVLLQQGKGADMGAAFGSGASGSLFGSSGSANFLSRSTAVLAAIFFASSLGLGYISAHKSKSPAIIAAQKALALPGDGADAKKAGQSTGPAGLAGQKSKEIPN